jgi:hypothetical protein
MRKIIFIFALMLFTYSSVLSQSDFEDKTQRPNDWGKSPSEKVYNNGIQEKSNIPDYLIEQFKNAKLSRNQSEKIRVGNEIQKFLKPSNPAPEGSYEPTKIVSNIQQPPFTPDWNPTDVTIYTGDVGYVSGYRQMDMKMGEDGWLYLAVNRRNVSGYNGAISIYRSSNGGLNWTNIMNAQNTAAYFGNISMLVEKRHATNNDSVRINVYYSRAAATTFNDATVEVLSTRRDGTGAFALNFASPPAGHKYEYPSACSDGMYWDVATYMHIIVREVSNDGLTYYGMRHFLTTDFGRTYTDVLIPTGNPDYYPSAAYCEKGTGNDSIYIAVERRITTTQYEIRALITCEWLTANHYVYYITAATAGIKYEKPCIAVQQQQANVQRRIMITCTKNNIARYHISQTGGASWMVDGALGSTTQLADFTWCNTDSLTSTGGYAIACFVDQNGDSITVRRGNIEGSLGPFLYKRNGFMSTGYLAPVCAVYKSGVNKYSAFAYAGQGPTNVYYNQEILPVGITPISNIADKFTLSQNYPNPFNPETNIKFSVAQGSDKVVLIVYDVMGRVIQTLVNETLKPGIYETSFDGSKLSSGVYFYKLTSGNFSEVKKMTFIK